MKICAYTNDASALKNAIDEKIDKKELKTWEKLHNNKSEVLYSHTPEQWKEKALLKPYIYNDRLELVINWWNNHEEPEESTKGYITGRFVEILLVHFKDDYTHLEIY
jgi:hypothetical protein